MNWVGEKKRSLGFDLHSCLSLRKLLWPGEGRRGEEQTLAYVCLGLELHSSVISFKILRINS